MMLLQSDRPIIMGILNVTADSFSDGGHYLEADTAVSHAVAMAEQGADIIDVGGESTRPGAQRVAAGGQKERVLPVIERLRDTLPEGVLISIDTTLAEVADAALQAGAAMINDISAGREDEDILRLAADRSIPMVLMHMQGTPATMQDAPAYVAADIGRQAVGDACADPGYAPQRHGGNDGRDGDQGNDHMPVVALQAVYPAVADAVLP